MSRGSDLTVNYQLRSKEVRASEIHVEKMFFKYVKNNKLILYRTVADESRSRIRGAFEKQIVAIAEERSLASSPGPAAHQTDGGMREERFVAKVLVRVLRTDKVVAIHKAISSRPCK